ncbi:peptidoglycan-binding protein [Streptomyces sp. NBC_00572]|uniref:peptidoglycan-binding domain-containing protein n=1 Tax=Streptomyces sp. NBC_00572 TaxID=2903664 RepID=UPI0022539DE9|nr:peptidoglycan-binding protein [Streptomyces sp. NBC_00572]MCX4983235.1 peptidoglycan-binding protein [Streptomyces sp. NBC_00572]
MNTPIGPHRHSRKAPTAMLSRLTARVAVGVAATTLAALALPGSAQAQPGAGYIGYGQANQPTAVWCVQKALNIIISDHFATQHDLISVDSAFGPETDEAIRYVQYRMLGAADADGIVGPRTGDLIMRQHTFDYQKCYPYVPTSR